MSATTDTTKVFIGDVAYDISQPPAALEYIIAMSVDNPTLMSDDVREAVTGFTAIGWNHARIANAIKERVKANAKAIHKDANRVDYAAKFAHTEIKWANKKMSIMAVLELVMVPFLAMLNAALALFNTANPDANLQLYALSGGKPKSRVGGKGEGRNYNRLANLITMHSALWHGKPIVIDYDARNLSYPVMGENGVTMIQYNGLAYTTFIDTREKDATKNVKPIPNGLVPGTTYPIGKLNQINTWVNGNVLGDNGLPNPVAAPNSWITCTLSGITIVDGDAKDAKNKKTIANPTLAQFYDQYKDTLQDGADDDDQDEPKDE